MQRLPPFLAAVALLLGAPAALVAQDGRRPPSTASRSRAIPRLSAVPDHRDLRIVVHQPINYRDIQRAITALFRTGQFDDVLVEQRTTGDGLFLVIKVKERPILRKWAVRGVEPLSEGEVKGRVKLVEGRPSTAMRSSSPAPPSIRSTGTPATTRHR